MFDEDKQVTYCQTEETLGLNAPAGLYYLLKYKDGITK